MRPSTGFERWLEALGPARQRGMKRAIVALAPQLAIVLHRMWVDETESRWTREAP